MGSALAKNYDVEKEATCSGGHCYLWQVFKATRKKDDKKVSVFYFNKADFEKRITQSLGAKRAKFVRDAPAAQRETSPWSCSMPTRLPSVSSVSVSM